MDRRNPSVGASFCKFLFDDDFSSKLRIPPEFVNKYGEILLPKMTLRTDYPSGKSWRVRIEQIGQRHFFTEGWSRFAEDVGLKHREYLIFKFVGGSEFHVLAYEITGCGKDCTSSGNEAVAPENFPVTVKTEDDQEIGSNVERTWKFSRELTKHHLMTRMPIPKDFAVGTGIATNRKIKLRDAKGMKWAVSVTDRNVGVYAMTAGWRDFLIGNDVLIGSVVSFEFIPGSGNIIQALVNKMDTAEAI